MPIWSPFVLGLAFLLSLGLSPIMAGLAHRFGFVDIPDKERKLHAGSMPLLGGWAIIIGVSVPLLLILIFSDYLTIGDIDDEHIVAIVLGLLVLGVGGSLDDKWNLRARYSIFFPLIAALIAVTSGIGVAKITNPIGEVFVLSSTVSIIVTYLWLVTMTYTTKLLDGVDGLASGVSLVGALMIAMLALSKTYFQPDVALMSLIVAAAVLGFLLWNLPPARIFLGEGGSTSLGFLLGTLAVISGSKLATILLVVGLPALDVVIVLLRRLWHGRPLAQGDRTHLHHLLSDRGWPPLAITSLYMCLAAGFGFTTLILVPWQKVVALSALFILGLCGIVLAGRSTRYVQASINRS